MALTTNQEPQNKASHITSVAQLIQLNNDETSDKLQDTLYIADDVFMPQKKNVGRCYRSDFTLKTKQEAEKLVATANAIISSKNKDTDFFVYNERTRELVPFKKNDYLIYDRGYYTFDGTNYISYDDNGQEIGKFSYTDKDELNADELCRLAA